MLPVNETELTWPELARRYVLSLLSMDGGLLCGSLTGVAGMEADSMVCFCYFPFISWVTVSCLYYWMTGSQI